MSEIRPNTEESDPTIFCFVTLDFDDPRIIDVEKNQEIRHKWVIDGLLYPPAGFKTPSFNFYHQHDDERIIGSISIGWTARQSLIGKQRALEQGVLAILGLLRDNDFNDMSFSRASMTRTNVSRPPTPESLEAEDVSIEAHVIEAQIRQFYQPC